MKTIAEIFKEHADHHGWSLEKQLDILLEFVDKEVKWNIFVGYMDDYHPLPFLPEEPPTPEQKARSIERQRKMELATCLLLFPDTDPDSSPVATYWFPTTFPEVIEQVSSHFSSGTYVVAMGDKNQQPICFDDGSFIMRKEVTV